MTLEDAGWLSVPFCGPVSCATRFITKGNTDMSNIIPMNYDDRSFPFASDCWFNATVAAKHHGRKVTEWLRLPSTKEYMAELCQELGIEGFNFKGGIFPPLVRIEKVATAGHGFIRSWRWNSPAGCQ
nr:Uncharacterised protein [Klebsiella pneumoniae]